MGCFEIVQCTCNHQENPLGLDRTPRFGWKMRSDTRGDAQTAYRITVSTDARRAQAGQGDVWDSGQTAGDGNVSVAYAGPPLQPRTRYYWCVTAWNRAGEAAVSRPAFFETGKLNEAWRARWITAPFLKMDKTDTGAPYLRRTFPLRGEVRSARLYICGLGYHEAFIEGKKVSENLLEPAFTKYDALSYYRVYDVTEHLPAAGPATLGVALGNGWYNCFTEDAWNIRQASWRAVPKLLCELYMHGFITGLHLQRYRLENLARAHHVQFHPQWRVVRRAAGAAGMEREHVRRRRLAGRRVGARRRRRAARG